jgi:hypothetical protein
MAGWIFSLGAAAEFFGRTGRKVLPRVGNITARAKPNIAQVVGKMGSLFNAVTDGMAVVLRRI